MNDLRSIASRMNELLPSWIEDYKVIARSEVDLTLAASFDFCYYHDLEIEFKGVEFDNCPERFRVTEARAVEGSEKSMAAEDYVFSPDCALLEISHVGGTCLIAARTVVLRMEMVYYYLRENLQPGERIADWVVRPQV